MFRSFSKKKVAFAAVGVIALLATAGTAFAYFTTSGSGSGTGTVGGSSNLTIHGVAAGPVYPGTNTTVTFTVDNPSPGHQQVGTITLTGIKACTGGTSTSIWNGSQCTNSGTEASLCSNSFTSGATNDTAKNFYMAPVVANQDLASGNAIAITAPGTLVMNNTNQSQDVCKNANLYLSFSS
jgi:hypothetical protein